MKKKKNILGMLGCVLAIIMSCSIGITSFNNIKSYAAEADSDDEHFIGYSGDMEEEALHNLTRLPHAVDDSPSITILVHGQGGASSHFSNDGFGKFVYEPDSMGDILSKSLAYSVKLYLAEFDVSTADKNDFFLYDLNENLNNPYADGVENFSYSSKKIKRMENTSQHSIIYFESSMPDDIHKEVYEELHTLIDKVSYDYLVLTGRIPKVNLISHSRGGLTSMMYATGYRDNSKTAKVQYRTNSAGELEEVSNVSYTVNGGTLINDHPFNVGELYSMGTPYWGTDWDTKFFGVAHTLLSDVFKTASAENILDSTIQQEIHQCWEDAVSVNPQLQLHAIAGEMKANFLPGLIAEEYNAIIEFAGLTSSIEIISSYVQLLAKNNEEISDFITAIELGIAGVSIGTTVACPVAGFILTILVAAPLTATLETGKNLIDSISDKVDVINATLEDSSDSDIWTRETLFALFADVLTDITELCEVVDEILAFVEDNPDYNIIGDWGDLFIDKDSQLANGYSNVIRYSKVFQYSVLEFEAVNGQYFLSENTSKNFEYKKSIASVGIPHNLETHDSEIIDYIESNIQMGRPQSIYEYVLDNGQVTIIDCAVPEYYGSSVWRNLDLNLTNGIDGHAISAIADNALEGLRFVKDIELPDTLTAIGSDAFAGCMDLMNIAIPEKVTNIGNGAFRGCDNLNISVSSNNSNYSAQNNILYNKNGTKLVATGNIGSTIVVPSGIVEILPYAFADNGNISSIRFLGTPLIGDYAFANCVNMSMVYFDSYSTPASVGENCFANIECFTIYTKYDAQDAYKNLLLAYEDHIASIPLTITFMNDGIVQERRTQYNGQTVLDLPVISEAGYTFGGWYLNEDSTGKSYEDGDLWEETADFNLYAKMTANEYLVTFDANGGSLDGTETMRVIYGQAYQTDTKAYKVGYTFEGWSDAEGNKCITADGVGTTLWSKAENTTLYADWICESYKIRIAEDGQHIIWLGTNGSLVEDAQDIPYGSVLNSINLIYTFKNSSYGFK